MGEQLTLRGELKGHNGWVTSIATTSEDPSMIISSSRDRTILLWTLTREEGNYYSREATGGVVVFYGD